jgi:hypothetical protein
MARRTGRRKGRHQRRMKRWRKKRAFDLDQRPTYSVEQTTASFRRLVALSAHGRSKITLPVILIGQAGNMRVPSVNFFIMIFFSVFCVCVGFV